MDSRKRDFQVAYSAGKLALGLYRYRLRAGMNLFQAGLQRRRPERKLRNQHIRHGVGASVEQAFGSCAPVENGSAGIKRTNGLLRLLQKICLLMLGYYHAAISQ